MPNNVDYLHEILKGLVTHPDAVDVSRSEDENGTLLTVKVHKDDMRFIIGTKGYVAEAIRTLVRAHSRKNDIMAGVSEQNKSHTSMKILEPS